MWEPSALLPRAVPMSLSETMCYKTLGWDSLYIIQWIQTYIHTYKPSVRILFHLPEQQLEARRKYRPKNTIESTTEA